MLLLVSVSIILSILFYIFSLLDKKNQEIRPPGDVLLIALHLVLFDKL